MRIVLVHPAGSNWIPGKKDLTPTANRMAPLGILSMAAYAEKMGHRVAIHDCLGPKAPGNHAGHLKKILDYRPDLVGFSTTTSGFLDGYELAAMIKKTDRRIKILFGGVHVSALGGVLLERFENIDYLCIGEGEETLAELASGASPAGIDGLIRRKNGQTVTNPPRKPIPDLDNLPFPSYEKLIHFPKGYHLPLFSYINTPGATLSTSRGCIFRCSYCDRSVFQRGYRYNSPEYVYAHMRYLNRRFGVRHLNIYDDLFTLDRPRITALCELLSANPLGVQFNCAVRVGYADDELLKMLKTAGCLQVSVGIETGDPELMAEHKPGVDIENAADTVRRIHRQGLRAKGLFMMGLPGDTELSIRRTSDFVMSLGLDDMNMSKFTPFPGAPIWNGIREFGIFEEDWRKMNCLNFVFLPKDIESFEKLDYLYNTHVKRFYHDRRWRQKFMGRLLEHRKSLIYMLKHLPNFLKAMRTFEPKRPG